MQDRRQMSVWIYKQFACICFLKEIRQKLMKIGKNTLNNAECDMRNMDK